MRMRDKSGSMFAFFTVGSAFVFLYVQRATVSPFETYHFLPLKRGASRAHVLASLNEESLRFCTIA